VDAQRSVGLHDSMVIPALVHRDQFGARGNDAPGNHPAKMCIEWSSRHGILILRGGVLGSDGKTQEIGAPDSSEELTVEVGTYAQDLSHGAHYA
jgi:hypothetical protein